MSAPWTSILCVDMSIILVYLFQWVIGMCNSPIIKCLVLGQCKKYNALRTSSTITDISNVCQKIVISKDVRLRPKERV